MRICSSLRCSSGRGSSREPGHAVGVVIFVFVVLLPCARLRWHRPIRDLEAVASRVWRGDAFGDRVVQSSVADTGVLRIGSMFNILLDGLSSDRARMRTLASEVVPLAIVSERLLAPRAPRLHRAAAPPLSCCNSRLRLVTAPTSALAARLGSALDSAKEIAEEVRCCRTPCTPGCSTTSAWCRALQSALRDATAGTGIDVDHGGDG